MSKQFNEKRFEQLQALRQHGLLTKEQKVELENLSVERLFSLIGDDTEVLDIIKRLQGK